MKLPERAIQVLDQIVGVFEADREAQKSFGSPRGWPFDRCPVFDQALSPSEARGAREYPALRGGIKRFSPSPSDFE